MKNIAAVLGAPDPEMAATERIFRDAGVSVFYASAGEKRVHAGNAYRADPIDALDRFDTVLLVECSLPTPKGVKVVVIDHHRPGDPGYGRPPAEFLAASSLGQVILYLSEAGIPMFRCERMPTEMGMQSGGWARFEFYDECWHVRREGADMADCSWLVRVPDREVLAAAADHCLAAAYAGRCPGVDPDALMRWRVETRAAFQKRSVQELLADVESARSILRGVRQDPCCGKSNGIVDLRGGACSRCGVPASIPSICLGDYGHTFAPIPELPEAAAREGIAFLSTVPSPDGRKKVVLQAASPEQVTNFLRDFPAQDKYGDPARGFAGGYEK